MIVALIVALAHAHGGEDHAPPPAPASASTDFGRVATWSSEFDAVVVVPEGAPGATLHGRVLIADHDTSAPVEAATVTLTLSGPGDLALADLASTAPGTYAWAGAIPAAGTWHGGLTVLTADRADVLGLPDFDWGPPPAAPHRHGWVWTLLAVAGGLLVGVAIGAIGGFGLGRASRGVIALGLVGALARADRVAAHGGADHAAPAAPTDHVEGLVLPLESQFLLGLRTEPAWPTSFTPAERLIGRAVIRPGGGAALAAPVAGTFDMEGTLIPGQAVREGQVLGRLVESLTAPDRATVLTGLTTAQVALASARRQLALAERDAASAAQLGGVLSQREILDRQQAVLVARESVRQAEVTVAQLGAATTVIRAPVSGRLASIDARPGDVVEAGRPLFSVVSGGPMWVEAHVPESVAIRLVAGAPAAITADARPGEAVAARVLDPGLTVDPDTGTARVVLETEDVGWLRPGMTVTGWVSGPTTLDTLTVPDSAIVESGGETLVFVKVGPERFEARPVALGAKAAGVHQVDRGLQPRDRVVIQGTTALRSLAGR